MVGVPYKAVRQMFKVSKPSFISHIRRTTTSPIMTSATRTSPRKSDPPVSQTTVKPEPRSPSPLRSVSPSETTSVPTDPRDIDYRAHPELYKILRGEMNVFKTQPYSDELKVLWRFKDEATARRSSAQLYERFEGFRSVRILAGPLEHNEKLTCAISP